MVAGAGQSFGQMASDESTGTEDQGRHSRPLSNDNGRPMNVLIEFVRDYDANSGMDSVSRKDAPTSSI